MPTKEDAMPYETITVEPDGSVVTVTMNRPQKRNAMTAAMFAELARVFTDLGADPSCRVIVLTGAGGAFSSGADLSPDGGEMPTGAPAFHARMLDIGRTIEAVATCPKPVIAAVGGVAAGAGANIAFVCDIILASADARFSQIFARRGLAVDGGGTWALPRLVGLHRAKELAFTADLVGAEEAERIGLVNRVVAADALVDEANALAAKIAANAPIALRLTKEGLNRSAGMTLPEALSYEAQAQAICLSSEDVAEGMVAFLQKRDPEFKGR